MASGTRPAHSGNSRNDARRQRRTKKLLATFAIYAVAGIAFVAVAGLLVLVSRGTKHEAGDAQPMSGAAPDFTLPSLSGDKVTLSSFKGQRNVLLYFNEGYGCAPCWQQAQEIQKRTAELDAANTELIVVMVDPPNLLKGEVSRWGLTMPVLTDTDRSVSSKYNMLGFGMHADKPNHTFVFVDKSGEIRWWEDYPSMRAPTDGVIKKVQALSAGS
ncbi:MAG: redoxin domain-containing protein [Dehalococcoidia bacterium]|nr:MAG: redoxin domain-containing protein [Dehalococcoidia bacterium]